MKSRSAFTLVEVMISIALALLLILAISQIFGIAQQTTGGGNAIISSVENDRSVMTSLTGDFDTMVDGPNTPGIVISSGAITAWRNAQDKQQCTTNNIGQFNPLPSTTTPIQLNFTQVNERIHRMDEICFFDRNKFIRQTGNTDHMTSPTSSNEAFIWLGHMALPNNSTITSWSPTAPQNGTWMNPGSMVGGTNDNNLFASGWVLGREVILLLPTATNEVEYAAPSAGFDPLCIFSSQANGIPSFASRYDLALTSVDQYQQFLQQFLPPNPPFGGRAWWQNLIGYNGGGFSDTRYRCNPFPVKPGANNATNFSWIPAMAAQTYPIFVKGCSQFIVEFAGDFVGQDPKSGQVTSLTPDGQIDFTVDPNTGAHKTRWYGFPRNPSDEVDAKGNPVIGVVSSVTGSFGTVNSVQYGVCPLLDTMEQDSTDWTKLLNNLSTTGGSLPERVLPTSTPSSNYITALQQPTAGLNPSGSPNYVVAWGVDTPTFPRPKMIRITFAIDDPTGHLSTSQIYEYVFTLP